MTGDRMLRITTSGASEADMPSSSVVVAGPPHHLEVGDVGEQGGQTVTDEEAVRGQQHPDPSRSCIGHGAGLPVVVVLAGLMAAGHPFGSYGDRPGTAPAS